MKNSPTVPATKEQAERGERGFNNGGSGWRWGETGEQFPKYDPSKPPGNIVGYESIMKTAPVAQKSTVILKTFHKLNYYS